MIPADAARKIALDKNFLNCYIPQKSSVNYPIISMPYILSPPPHLDSSRTEGAGLNPLISIIIPVYNVERYLRECLDSVVNQTMRDLQIICVNDGSPDNSRTILQEYADKDNRIQIIDQENGGLASARNAAFPYIKGKYTLFVDSDDWIDLQLCEKVYAEAEQTGAEMTMFFYWTASDGKSLCTDWLWNHITEGTKTTVTEKSQIVAVLAVWAKLWRTNFLQKHDMRFIEGFNSEDVWFTYQGCVLAQKIAVLREELYHYRQNPDSITLKKPVSHALDCLPVLTQLRTWLESSGHWDTWNTYYIRSKFNILHWEYLHCPEEAKPLFIKQAYSTLTKEDRAYCHSKNCPSYIKEFYLPHFGTVGEKMTVVLRETISLPERLVRNHVIKPLKKRFAA
ncbi:hypothetical protein FACS1894189_4600 [Planctomycetales bacterium]|nr:hypothetical protein FACS1894189_4600 [Planctomycetales bacterium]